MPQPRSSRSSSHPRRPLIGANTERCIYCEGTRITREGKRYKKLETVQLWFCHDCDRVFTPQIVKGKTFPLKVILESLCLYYRGETRQRVAARITERFGMRVSPRTLSQWLAEYHELTTYARLRSHGLSRFTPHALIRSTRLHHKQVYMYRVHQGKLALILADKQHEAFSPVAEYLTEMATSCPHDAFPGRAPRITGSQCVRPRWCRDRGKAEPCSTHRPPCPASRHPQQAPA